jgi:hypothetical protein
MPDIDQLGHAIGGSKTEPLKGDKAHHALILHQPHRNSLFCVLPPNRVTW